MKRKRWPARNVEYVVQHFAFMEGRYQMKKVCDNKPLPPVAIKPPTSIRELANKIMQACIDSPTKFLGESIETILRDELVAIKPGAPFREHAPGWPKTAIQMLERIEQRWQELQDRDVTNSEFACLMSDLSNFIHEYKASGGAL